MRRLVLMLLCFTLAACASRSGETNAVKGVIMRYNQLLADCYRSLNMNPMQEVSTPEHATKLYYHMAALGEGGVRMVSQLKKIEFLEVKFPEEGEAVVRTRELWDFTHYGIRMGEKQYEEKDFPYEMTYRLTQRNGRWLVAGITAATGRRDNAAPAPQGRSTSAARPRPAPAAGHHP